MTKWKLIIFVSLKIFNKTVNSEVGIKITWQLYFSFSFFFISANLIIISLKCFDINIEQFFFVNKIQENLFLFVKYHKQNSETEIKKFQYSVCKIFKTNGYHTNVLSHIFRRTLRRIYYLLQRKTYIKKYYTFDCVNGKSTYLHR